MFHSSDGIVVLDDLRAELVGARDHRAARLARVEEGLAVDLARHGVVDDEARLEALVLLRVSHVSIQKLSMRTISFCSSPIEPETSIM
jgi:hypothetical protein